MLSIVLVLFSAWLKREREREGLSFFLEKLWVSAVEVHYDTD
jgi:hypothetical protein